MIIRNPGLVAFYIGDRIASQRGLYYNTDSTQIGVNQQSHRWKIVKVSNVVNYAKGSYEFRTLSQGDNIVILGKLIVFLWYF